MQIIYPTPRQTILADIIVWSAFIIIATVIGRLIPQERIDRWNFFQPFSFETERFYRTVVRIDRWKHLLPDGAALRKRGFSKRHLKQTDTEYLLCFSRKQNGQADSSVFDCSVLGVRVLDETRLDRSDVPACSRSESSVYSGQRYNRPRLQRLHESKTKRDANASLRAITTSFIPEQDEQSEDERRSALSCNNR
jgi:hypothetical protein